MVPAGVDLGLVHRPCARAELVYSEAKATTTIVKTSRRISFLLFLSGLDDLMDFAAAYYCHHLVQTIPEYFRFATQIPPGPLRR